MLSDHERLRLERIKAQLMADDPEFVAVFETGQRKLADRYGAGRNRPSDRVCTIVMAVVIVLGLLQLMDGVVGGALFMAAIATGAYFVRRHGLLPPQNV